MNRFFWLRVMLVVRLLFLGVAVAATPAETELYKSRLTAALGLLDDLKFLANYREPSQLERDFPARAAEFRPLRLALGRVTDTKLDLEGLGRVGVYRTSFPG